MISYGSRMSSPYPCTAELSLYPKLNALTNFRSEIEDEPSKLIIEAPVPAVKGVTFCGCWYHGFLKMSNGT